MKELWKSSRIKKTEPENRLPDEFITMSEVVYFWNCSYDFAERNRQCASNSFSIAITENNTEIHTVS